MREVHLVVLLCMFGIVASEANFEDTRCRCVCPSTAFFSGDNSTESDNHRRYYTKTNINPSICNPPYVVKAEALKFVDESRMDAFLANCDCRYESRNTVMLKVVVIFIICVIMVLVSYMSFLTCLQPIMRRKRLTTPFRRNDEMEDNIFARPTESGSDGSVNESQPETSTTRARNSGSNVLDRVEAEQSRWMKKVEVQRRNIFEDHTMLN